MAELSFLKDRAGVHSEAIHSLDDIEVELQKNLVFAGARLLIPKVKELGKKSEG